MKKIIYTLILLVLFISCDDRQIVFEKSLLFTDFNTPIVEFSINNEKYNFIIDSGSEHSFINEGIINKNDITDTIYTTIETFQGETDIQRLYKTSILLNDSLETEMLATNIISIIKNTFIKSGHIVNGVIGNDFLNKYNAVIDYENKQLILHR